MPGTWALTKAEPSPADRNHSLQTVTVRVVVADWPEPVDPESEAEQVDPYVVA